MPTDAFHMLLLSFCYFSLLIKGYAGFSLQHMR